MFMRLKIASGARKMGEGMWSVRSADGASLSNPVWLAYSPQTHEAYYPMTCDQCGSEFFKISRWRFSDFTKLIRFRFPIRCLRCYARNFVRLSTVLSLF